MSTICLTVHELRALLGASDEDHTCQSPAVEIVEQKTADYWSTKYQLEPAQLDECIDYGDSHFEEGQAGKVKGEKGGS